MTDESLSNFSGVQIGHLKQVTLQRHSILPYPSRLTINPVTANSRRVKKMKAMQLRIQTSIAFKSELRGRVEAIEPN